MFMHFHTIEDTFHYIRHCLLWRIQCVCIWNSLTEDSDKKFFHLTFDYELLSNDNTSDFYLNYTIDNALILTQINILLLRTICHNGIKNYDYIRCTQIQKGWNSAKLKNVLIKLLGKNKRLWIKWIYIIRNQGWNRLKLTLIWRYLSPACILAEYRMFVRIRIPFHPWSPNPW